MACAYNPSIQEVKTKKLWIQESLGYMPRPSQKDGNLKTKQNTTKTSEMLAWHWVLSFHFGRSPDQQTNMSPDRLLLKSAVLHQSSSLSHILHNYPFFTQPTETSQFFLGLWVFTVRTLCHVKLWPDKSVNRFLLLTCLVYGIPSVSLMSKETHGKDQPTWPDTPLVTKALQIQRWVHNYF